MERICSKQAARQQAQLVLLPEFVSAGYAWTKALWDTAEGTTGPTVSWLRDMSRRLGVWLGTSYLEAVNGNFYDTFVLMMPDGTKAGRVRKQAPALWEAFFFKGAPGMHVIESPIGRIGVGICYDNYLALLPKLMHQQSVDLMLMPHSAPSLAESFPLWRHSIARFNDDLRNVASFYAGLLGVPVVMANKCGPWHSGLSFEKSARFLGCSAIADSTGELKTQLGGEERVIIADVNLDPRRKKSTPPPHLSRWCTRTLFSRSIAGPFTETIGSLSYRLSLKRRAKARATA